MPSFSRKSIFIPLIATAVLINLQAAALADQPLPTSSWNPPLEPPIRLVNQYRQPNSDYSAGHRGVDYLVQNDQIVMAPADGKVWFAGQVAQRPLLSVLHDGGYLTEYEPVCTDLKSGETVFAGQEIARVCPAGSNYIQHCSSALCLHFSMRHLGAYLSPLVFIGGLNPSRLFATRADGRSYNHLEVAR